MYAAKKKKRVSLYQVSPSCISSLKDIHDICAGGSHALAVGRKGEVYAWGKNDLGQCALVPIHPGVTETVNGQEATTTLRGQKKATLLSIWFDVWKTRQVPGFGECPDFDFSAINYRIEAQLVFAKHIAAGQASSAVVVSNGQLWTWGGGSCGENNGTGNVSRNVSYSNALQPDNIAHSYCDTSRIARWGKPSRMAAVAGVKVKNVNLDSSRSIAVSETGTLLLWGKGLTATEDQDCESGGDTWHSESKTKTNQMPQSPIANVEVPRQPVPAWLAPIHGRETIKATCGGGNICCPRGSPKSWSITKQLAKLFPGTNKFL